MTDARGLLASEGQRGLPRRASLPGAVFCLASTLMPSQHLGPAATFRNATAAAGHPTIATGQKVHHGIPAEWERPPDLSLRP